MPGPFLCERFDAAAVRKNNKPRTNRERKEGMQRVFMSLGFCIKPNMCKPSGLGKFLFITVVFLSYCFHRSCLETSFSHSCKYTSENINDAGWEQGTISSHSWCRKNGTPIDSPKLAPGHQQTETFCLGGSQELWKPLFPFCGALLCSGVAVLSDWCSAVHLLRDPHLTLFCQKRPCHGTESRHHRWGNSEEPLGLVKR